MPAGPLALGTLDRVHPYRGHRGGRPLRRR